MKLSVLSDLSPEQRALSEELNINHSLAEKIIFEKYLIEINWWGLGSGGERVDIYRLIKGLSGGERREERLAGDGETFSGAQTQSTVRSLALRW